MATQVQAVAWLTAQIGQHLDYDHAYGQQCVDFFNYYYQFLTGDSPYNDGYGVSGAKDLWNVANTRFTMIPDSASLVPQPGDVLIYGSTWGGGFGHVEVCLSSDANGAYLAGENEHNNASEGVVRVYRTWAQMKGLIGVMRPNYSTVTKGDVPMTPDQEKQAYEIVLGREPEGASTGRSGFQFILDARAELAAKQKAAQDQINGLQAQITQLNSQANDLQAKVDQLTKANLDLADKLTIANQPKPITDSQTADVVAAKANPLASFLKLVLSKLKIGG